MGRPRTTTPEDDELEKLGSELVKWATEPCKDLRFHLKQWWCLEKGLLKKQWDLMCEKPIFQAYYERAQTALSRRYVDGSINASIANRFVRLYFPEVRKEEDEKAKYLANLNKEDIGMSMVDMVNILRENGYLDKVDDKDKS